MALSKKLGETMEGIIGIDDDLVQQPNLSQFEFDTARNKRGGKAPL